MEQEPCTDVRPAPSFFGAAYTQRQVPSLPVRCWRTAPAPTGRLTAPRTLTSPRSPTGRTVTGCSCPGPTSSPRTCLHRSGHPVLGIPAQPGLPSGHHCRRPRCSRTVLEQQVVIDQHRHHFRVHRPELEIPGCQPCDEKKLTITSSDNRNTTRCHAKPIQDESQGSMSGLAGAISSRSTPCARTVENREFILLNIGAGLMERG